MEVASNFVMWHQILKLGIIFRKKSIYLTWVSLQKKKKQDEAFDRVEQAFGILHVMSVSVGKLRERIWIYSIWMSMTAMWKHSSVFKQIK